MDMIKKLSYNRDLKKANRDKIKEGRVPNSNIYTKNNSFEIKKKDISEEELEKVKDEMRKEMKKQRQKELILYLSVIAFLVILLLLFIL